MDDSELEDPLWRTAAPPVEELDAPALRMTLPCDCVDVPACTLIVPEPNAELEPVLMAAVPVPWLADTPVSTETDPDPGSFEADATAMLPECASALPPLVTDTAPLGPWDPLPEIADTDPPRRELAKPDPP